MNPQEIPAGNKVTLAGSVMEIVKGFSQWIQCFHGFWSQSVHFLRGSIDSLTATNHPMDWRF